METPEKLTLREIVVLSYLIKGLSPKKIADVLKLSVETIRTYIRNLHSKSDTHSNPELIYWGTHTCFNNNGNYLCAWADSEPLPQY